MSQELQRAMQEMPQLHLCPARPVGLVENLKELRDEIRQWIELFKSRQGVRVA